VALPRYGGGFALGLVQQKFKQKFNEKKCKQVNTKNSNKHKVSW